VKILLLQIFVQREDGDIGAQKLNGNVNEIQLKELVKTIRTAAARNINDEH
jgi:hypothetical protein